LRREYRDFSLGTLLVLELVLISDSAVDVPGSTHVSFIFQSHQGLRFFFLRLMPTSLRPTWMSGFFRLKRFPALPYRPYAYPLNNTGGSIASFFFTLTLLSPRFGGRRRGRLCPFCVNHTPPHFSVAVPRRAPLSGHLSAPA